MPRLLNLLILAVILCSCAGNTFDEATIPPDQLNAELAFKRMSNHGGLEPVLEENEEFVDWQFHAISKSETATAGDEAIKIFNLRDRSGIEYTVSSSSTSAAVIEKISPGYGYGSGKVVSVKRDLAAGEIEAEISLSSWRERE